MSVATHHAGKSHHPPGTTAALRARSHSISDTVGRAHPGASLRLWDHDGLRRLDRTWPWTAVLIDVHWVIRDRVGSVGAETGQVLGAIGTRPREVPGRADVGYWLGRPYWGSGLMTEALSALLDYCFTSLNGHKIEADVFTHNVRGRRLVEKVGMKQEGVIRHAHCKGGEWVDQVVYGMLAEEWPGA